MLKKKLVDVAEIPIKQEVRPSGENCSAFPIKTPANWLFTIKSFQVLIQSSDRYNSTPKWLPISNRWSCSCLSPPISYTWLGLMVWWAAHLCLCHPLPPSGCPRVQWTICSLVSRNWPWCPVLSHFRLPLLSAVLAVILWEPIPSNRRPLWLSLLQRLLPPLDRKPKTPTKSLSTSRHPPTIISPQAPHKFFYGKSLKMTGNSRNSA